MPLRFWKYHGLGNDFLLVEGDEVMTAERAVRLCDRRRGVGGDGVLTVLPPRARDAPAAAFMHIYNSDGSVAAMCGNGIRCVARHLAERRSLRGAFLVDTASGPRRCEVLRGPGGEVSGVSVEMGPGRYEGEARFEAAGQTLQGHRVSMGNPHAIFFGEATRERAARLGPAVERAVAGGVNAGFAALRPGGGGIDLVVWERGAGLTDACGTGACAAVVAAVASGRLPAREVVEVRLPGGPLAISVGPDLAHVTMRGPAELAFEGSTEL